MFALVSFFLFNLSFIVLKRIELKLCRFSWVFASFESIHTVTNNRCSTTSNRCNTSNRFSTTNSRVTQRPSLTTPAAAVATTPRLPSLTTPQRPTPQLLTTVRPTQQLLTTPPRLTKRQRPINSRPLLPITKPARPTTSSSRPTLHRATTPTTTTPMKT